VHREDAQVFTRRGRGQQPRQPGVLSLGESRLTPPSGSAGYAPAHLGPLHVEPSSLCVCAKRCELIVARHRRP